MNASELKFGNFKLPVNSTRTRNPGRARAFHIADCVVRRPPGTEPQAGPLALQVADAVTHLRPDSEHVVPRKFAWNSPAITGVTVTVGANEMTSLTA